MLPSLQYLLFNQPDSNTAYEYSQHLPHLDYVFAD